LKEATRSLANKTGTLAIATTNEGEVFISGYSNILEMPEFYDIDITKTLLATLDEDAYFFDLCRRFNSDEEEIHVLMGR